MDTLYLHGPLGAFETRTGTTEMQIPSGKTPQLCTATAVEKLIEVCPLNRIRPASCQSSLQSSVETRTAEAPCKNQNSALDNFARFAAFQSFNTSICNTYSSAYVVG